MINTHRFLLETVTPLFLGGEDRSLPELRAPSLRGTLRYWWRALAAEADLPELERRETMIFGSTEQRSPIVIRLSQPETNQHPEWQRRPSRGRPTASGPLDYNAGINYLGFSLAKRHYIVPRQQFGLLVAERKSSGAQSVLPSALAALWVVLWIGGLGSRSRRGFGSIQAVQAPPLANLPSFRFRGSPGGLASFLSEGLRHCRDLIPIGSTESDVASYSQLRSRVARIVVLNRTWATWDAALGTIGAALQRARIGLAPTMAQMAGPGPLPAALPRAGFGLPIQYFNPRLGKYALEVRGVDGSDRRASPLIIRVVQLERDRFGVILVLMRAEFLPHDAYVSTGSGKRGTATLGEVERFVDTAGGFDDRGQPIGVLEVEVP